MSLKRFYGFTGLFSAKTVGIFYLVWDAIAFLFTAIVYIFYLFDSLLVKMGLREPFELREDYVKKVVDEEERAQLFAELDAKYDKQFQEELIKERKRRRKNGKRN